MSASGGNKAIVAAFLANMGIALAKFVAWAVFVPLWAVAVYAVVAHWVETGPWWQGAASRATDGGSDHAGAVVDLVAERELWRVEAGRGAPPVRPVPDDEAPPTYGVFDLSFDWTDGRWQLVGCLD